MDGAIDENCDERVKIINRECEYDVSKKLICSKVPYFRNMFNSGLKESKRNVVKLDFDEIAFDCLINWVHNDFLTIRMDKAIILSEMADYFMMDVDGYIFFYCHAFFHCNFNVDYLPVVLPQVTKVSKLINPGTVDTFICRHFLLIANTNSFLHYPVETVETILKLDLMIYSEYQIFESIMKWVNHKKDSRLQTLPHLLSYVRWRFIDSVDLSKIKDNELIKNLPKFDSIISSIGQCGFDRSNQNFFITFIDIIDGEIPKVRLHLYNDKLYSLPIGDFTQSDDISLDFVYEDKTSDILFDSGTKGVRIDWINQTFRWLDFEFLMQTYYSDISKSIIRFQVNLSEFSCFLDENATELPNPISTEYLLLESNGKFILIGKTRKEKKLFGIFPVLNQSWFDGFRKPKHSFHATVLDNVVYILTKDLEFIQFNYETRSYNKSEPFKYGYAFEFDSVYLTSHQTKADAIILVDKTSDIGRIHVYCTKRSKWTYNYADISNTKFDFTAFTAAFIYLKNIKPAFGHKFFPTQ